MTEIAFSLTFDDEGAAASARAAALGDLRDAAESVLAEFDSPPSGSVSCTPLQYAYALDDADFRAVLADGIAALQALSAIDWSDQKQVGGAGRRAIAACVESAERLLQTTRELAWLIPPTALEAVATGATDTAHEYAQLLVGLLSALTSTSSEDAAPHAERIATNFPVWAPYDDLAGLVETADWTDAADVDERVALVTGIPGDYTDELGIPDPAKLLVPFAEAVDPAAGLAAAGATYLAPLLEGSTPATDATGLMLPVIATTIAVLDRPLRSFRIGRRTRALTSRAWDLNDEVTKRWLAWALDEGWRAYEAHERVRTELMRLARSEPTDADAAQFLMTLYRRSAETGYRVLATLLVGLVKAASGGGGAPPDELATLAPLRDALQGTNDEACVLVRESVEPAIRNAEAHEEWRWDARAATIRGVGDDPLELTLDELNEHIELLSGAIAGVEAALICFLIERDISVAAGAWVTSAPRIRDLIGEILCRGLGLPLDGLSYDDDAAALHVVLRSNGTLPLRSWAVAAGLASFAYRDAASSSVRDADTNSVLLELAPQAVAAWAEAECDKDLWHFVPMIDAGIRAGRDPATVCEDGIALMLMLVENLNLDGVADAFVTRDFAPIGLFAARLRTVEHVARRFLRHWSQGARACVEHISAAHQSAEAARSGDEQAHRRMAEQLVAADKFKEVWSARRGGTQAMYEELTHPPTRELPRE